MNPSRPTNLEWEKRYSAAQEALTTHNYQTAANEYHAAVELAEELNLDERIIADSLEGLAVALSLTNATVDVGPIWQHATQIRDSLLAESEKSLGMHNLTTAECLGCCASNRAMQRKYDEAIDFHQRALEVRKRLHGEFHFDVANTLTVMAGIYRMHQGDKETAAELWSQAAKILECLHENADTNSTKVAASLRGNLENLAVYAYDRGDYGMSENLFRRVVDVLNSTCATTGRTLPCNAPTFAKVLIHQKKFEEAENILDAAATCNSRLAAAYNEAKIELYKATGRMDEAEPSDGQS